MKVLFVASEAYPLVKTGGLADVAGALPAALAALGDDVRLLLPAYPGVLEAARHKGKPLDLGEPSADGPARLVPARMPGTGVRLWLLDCPALFDRPEGGPYLGPDGTDWPDNDRRFALLARAAAMICVGGALAGWRPDVVHANDWQAGLLPAYLHQWGGPVPPSLLTVHNIEYQGVFPAESLARVGLLAELFTPQGVEFYGGLSFLKAGAVYADRITTVSPTYAEEIRRPEFGCGFEGLMADRGAALTGILNGVDDTVWDPATDRALAAPYSADDPSGKAACKADLQRRMGLDADPAPPLLGMVTRLTPQKGIDLLLEALPEILGTGAQLAMIGEGDPALVAEIRRTIDAHPGRCALYVGYDESLAHRVMAGADMLLVPSRFEPCGLTQLYALRYGTLPVVRRTGGLADSVVDAAEPEGTGFVFQAPTAAELLRAVRRAVAARAEGDTWRTLQRRAMARDFSWRRAAAAYHALYRDLAGGG